MSTHSWHAYLVLQQTVTSWRNFEKFSSGYRNLWEDSAEINASDWQYLLCNKTSDLTIRLNGILTVVVYMVSSIFRKCCNVYVQSVIKLTGVFSSTMTRMQINNISYTTVIESRATRFGAFFTLFMRHLNGRPMAKIYCWNIIFEYSNIKRW